MISRYKHEIAQPVASAAWQSSSLLATTSASLRAINGGQPQLHVENAVLLAADTILPQHMPLKIIEILTETR